MICSQQCKRMVAVLVWLLLGFVAPHTYANSVDRHAHGAKQSPYPAVDLTKGDPEVIKRGEYLAKVGNCIACHTDSLHGGKAFAGNLGIETPFGIFYSPNITFDHETGIGNWTEADFEKAMRKGKAPDGSNYFPVFPYQNYNILTDDDIHALYVYLKSVPKVHENKKPNDVPFPFNWRFAQYGWKMLFFDDQGPYHSDPNRSPEWNRGKYLTEGLGHCNMCHTPRNILGGMKQKYAYTGALVQGYYAPDISSSGITDSTLMEMLRVFKFDELLRERGNVSGPMKEVNHDSLRFISVQDLRNISIYLRTVKSEHPYVHKPSTGNISAELGKNIYEGKCSVCHDAGTAGAPKLTDAEAWRDRLAKGEEILFEHSIKGFNSMPVKGTCLSCNDDDIKSAVLYMVERAKLAKDEPAKQPKEKALTLVDGKVIYETHCAVCHENGKALSLKASKEWIKIAEQSSFETILRKVMNGDSVMPPMGGCKTCRPAEVKAAVKYLLTETNPEKDYRLW